MWGRRETMKNDHLEDAMLHLRHVLDTHAAYGRFDEYRVRRAIDEIEAEVRNRPTAEPVA
jgi:hypothetical protein